MIYNNPFECNNCMEKLCSSRFREILPGKRVISPESGREDDGTTTSRVHVIFAIFLAALAVVTGYLQYFAKPARCWTPSEFTRAMADYSNSICYFSSHYYLPLDQPIPEPTPVGLLPNYYKWTPFGLLFLSALYVIPELVKNMVSKVFKINVGNTLELSRQTLTGSAETRFTAIKQLTVDLQYRLDENEKKSRKAGFRRWVTKISPSLQLCTWLQRFTGKLCLLIGSVLPVWFLYSLLGIDFKSYNKIVNNKLPTNETYFPEVILCDFSIRRLTNIVHYTVQCHLPANDMFERISLLVGFLALVVSSVSSSDVICSIVARLFQPKTRTYIKKHMSVITTQQIDRDIAEYEKFAERCLGKDEMYLLWLIGQNSAETVVCQILSRLWETYKTKQIDEKITLKPPPYYVCGKINTCLTDR